MCGPARMSAYQKSWGQVQQAYCGESWCQREASQAVPYEAFQANLPGVHIVIKPTWEMVGGSRSPALVLVEGGEPSRICRNEVKRQGRTEQF